MASNYNCLLFDVDGTLLDFRAAEQEAILETLRHFKLPSDEETAAKFSAINAALWASLERGEIQKEKLVVSRFTQLLAELSAKGDPIRMNNDFMTRLSGAAAPYPGAGELLEELAEFATLAVVTNGTAKVQTQRLKKSGLYPYFDGIFVSETLGVTKPAARFFDLALKTLGVKNKQKVLVIGDSLTADIRGGANAKLHTCWCNFNGAENNTKIQPTYTVTGFAQLKIVAVGEEELALAATREKRHV